MTFIALETTGDLWLTTAVLIAVIVASQLTREVFGYSFATWRFHLRGETIRSAADIGWMRDLTVGKMMRQDVRTVPATTTVAAFREAFPLGSTGLCHCCRRRDRYAGMVQVADAHAAESARKSDRRTCALSRRNAAAGHGDQGSGARLRPRRGGGAGRGRQLRDRRVIGLLTEAYALRRYAAELERAAQEMLGQRAKSGTLISLGFFVSLL